MSNTTNKLFTEALRPKELNNMVLLPRIYNEVKNGLVQNVLFEGIQGTGKCLGYDEEIDIYVDDEIYDKFFK